MAGDLKTREEYLIAYHDKLLAERKDTTDLINNHLIFAYVLLGLAIAIKGSLIVKLSAGGPEFDLSKPIILDYLVVLMFLTYVIIDYNLRRFARILQETRKNSSNLTALNPQARPVDIRDIGLFVSGVAGLMLAMARAEIRLFFVRLLRLGGFHLAVEFSSLLKSSKDGSITKREATRLTYRLARHTAVWLIRLFTIFFWPFVVFGYRILVGFAILFIPLISTIAYTIADRMQIPPYQGGKLPAYIVFILQSLGWLHVLLWTTFLLIIVGTFYASITLFVRYTIDLLDDFFAELDASLTNVETAAATFASVVGASLPVDYNQTALKWDEFRRTLERARTAVRNW